jgi:hypothetical protein
MKEKIPTLANSRVLTAGLAAMREREEDQRLTARKTQIEQGGY